MRLRYFIAILALSFSTAYGAKTENVTFNYRQWDTKDLELITTRVSQNCIVIEGQNNEWQGLGEKGKTTYYAVRGDVKRKTINCFGVVHLVLLDGAHLTCTGGIKVERPNAMELHIHTQSDGDNKGRLTVTNSYTGAAAIGGAEDMQAADIYIHGGTVTATGSEHAAGIGSGRSDKRQDCGAGEICIYAGDVTAQGGHKAAGIGSGCAWDDRTCSAGVVHIYGGTVNANGGSMGAGIGGGGGRDKTLNWAERMGSNGGNVEIYGGTVTARGGYRAAGIGSGSTNNFKAGNRHGGSLRVYGGTVTATGGDYGAGIGGGCNAQGADVEIKGGTVRAQGGKSSAGIGGGEDGETGKTRIYGGKVTAIAGEGCEGREAGKGGAIGFGKGKSKKYKPEHMEIGDVMSVTAGDHETNIERTFTTSERVDACKWRNFARIEVCTHQDATYTLIDGEKHRRSCIHCAAASEVPHDFGSSANHHDCACGQKYDSETTVFTITRHYLNPANPAATLTSVDKVARSKDYMLPAPPAIKGMHFMGYSTKMEVGEMLDSEEGTFIDISKPVALTGNADYYARYRYDFQTEWLWNDDNTEAQVVLTNAIMGGSETIPAKCSLAEDQKPTADTQHGRLIYKGAATYQRDDDNGSITYTFTDEQVIDYYNVDVITLDAYEDNNEDIVEQYKDRLASVTIKNLTLRKDGQLHALCLPFSMQIKGSPLEGATIYSAVSETIRGGQLEMTFQPVTSGWVAAGEPYFVKWPQGTDIEDPEFPGVHIIDGSLSVQDQYYELGGTFDPIAFDDDDTVFALEDGKLTPLDANIADAFSNYLYIPFEKNADGEIGVTTIRLVFEGDITVETDLYDQWEGNGTADSPYLVYSTGQLQRMANDFNSNAPTFEGKYFRQVYNIGFDKTKENNYKPAQSFRAHYDGAGHVISGLNLNMTGAYSAGLFEELENDATVKNVIVRDSRLKGNSGAAIANSMIGAATIDNCHVLNSVTVEVETSAGGIVGAINDNNARVTGCTSHATVKGYSGVGGITGFLNRGHIDNCIALGSDITGSVNVGAVVGYRNSGPATIQDCYFTSPTLTDSRSALMPDRNKDNTNFLTLLAARDEFLLANSGLTKEQIGYDLKLNNRPTLSAIQNADGTWKSKAYTLCPPFDVDLTQQENAESVKVYKLHEVDLENKVLTFTNEFPIMKAGEPYIIVMEKGSIDIATQNVTVAASPQKPTIVYTADGSKEAGWWCGTLKRMEQEQLESEKAYILQGNGTFKCVPVNYKGAFVYPFVAYFSSQRALDFGTFQTKFIQTENGEDSGDIADFPADEFDFDFDFGDETGINVVHGEGFNGDGYYDLQGRKFDGEPTLGGIYIQNGKKIIK